MARKKRTAKPSASPKTLMLTLSRRGPHKVLRGDLGIVGVSGQVFTPASGTGLPAIAFGHSWLNDSRRYRDLLYHLASWGIVTAAPDGQRGVLASDVALAADLRVTLDVVSRVPLGVGDIRVDPERLGLVGHGFGAAAAVIAASDSTLLGQSRPRVRSVAALFPAPTTSELLPAAARVSAPGLIVAGDVLDGVDANGLPLARAYGGDVVLRSAAGATAAKLLERRTIKGLIGINGADRKVHAAVRAALTGYLLHTLTDDPEYQDFVDPEVTLGSLGAVDLDDPPGVGIDPLSRLLGAKQPKKRSRVR